VCPETDVFCEVIKFETVWPGDLPWRCYALNYGRYVEEGPLELRNVSFCPPEWLIVILGWKGNERPVKGMERVPYGPKTNGNLIRCQLQIFCKYPGGFEKVDPGAENRVL
jgi:hypothetical protein